MNEVTDDTMSAVRNSVDARNKVDRHLSYLLEQKFELLQIIDEINEEMIAPKKSAIAHIESEIEDILFKSQIEKAKSDHYSVKSSDSMAVTIVDPSKAIAFATKYPHLLLSKFLKDKELKDLIDSGIVPDPDLDGIDVSKTYKKISYRRI